MTRKENAFVLWQWPASSFTQGCATRRRIIATIGLELLRVFSVVGAAARPARLRDCGHAKGRMSS
jgi:hypothetical protein